MIPTAFLQILHSLCARRRVSRLVNFMASFLGSKESHLCGGIPNSFFVYFGMNVSRLNSNVIKVRFLVVHSVIIKDVKNGSYCFPVKCATLIERLVECLGLKQAQLITIHSKDSQTQVVQSKSLVVCWMLLNLIPLMLGLKRRYWLLLDVESDVKVIWTQRPRPYEVIDR